MTAEPPPTTASIEHLSAVLRRSGVLGDGRIASVVVESSRPTVLSRIVRLRLTYDGATADAPRALILKTAHPDRVAPTWNAGRQEVAFYTDVAAATAARALPRCFEAAWDKATNAWHLLLEDLTETHMAATTWPLPPNAAQCESIIAGWARFHAAWWDDPRLGASIGVWSDDLDAYLQRFAEKLAAFAQRHGDRLPGERRDLFDRLLKAAPRLTARYRTHRNLTIIHGDAHVWNCLLPRDGGGDDVRLLDWDSWRVDTATDDLAYMMAMHWYPDRRRRLEQALLDRYHATLIANGVRGYDRRALGEDYRLSALWLLMRPVWQEANNIPPVIWWNNLERIMLAVDDLGCSDFLD
jgi:Phosphotransferase enzyme family